MSKIILTGVVEGISTRMDNSFKITVGTNEIEKESVSELFELRNKFVKILITDNNIDPLTENVIVETKMKDGKRVKSKAQKLRSVLWCFWEQQGIPGEFDDFYNTQLEALIDNWKSKLE